MITRENVMHSMLHENQEVYRIVNQFLWE
nr:alpha/beta hydrolase [Enterococcus villorum]